MKRFILYSLFLTIGIMGVQSAVPEGYYDSLNGLTGRALRKAAANRVRSHTAISYSSGTWTAFVSIVSAFPCVTDLSTPPTA